MGNIVAYIQEKQQTFAESPFYPADPLVPARLPSIDVEAGKLVARPSPAPALPRRGALCEVERRAVRNPSNDTYEAEREGTLPA